MKKSKSNTFKLYWVLCALRILLVFIPQTGYIHPDEYFQSMEVFASNIFKIEGNIPWDFNVTFPIRSVGLQYLTTGLSYSILKTFDMLLKGHVRNFVTPYSLVVVPRLLICLLSFLCDWSLYRICLNNNERYKSKLLILSSSYVMLIFGSRTFTNTIELILFSLLLYYVAESMIFSNVIIKHQEYLQKRYEKSQTPTEKAKFHKLRLFLAPHNMKNFFYISTITVFGFFNRPTFLCYAMFPIFFWINRGIGFKSVSNMQSHLRMLVLVICAIPSIIALVLIDSFYYGYLSWGEIGMLDISLNNFVVPSLNFIKYNLKDSKEHGLHPRYLHLLVNIPILFNVLGMYIFVMLGDFVIKFSRKKYHLLPTVRSIKGLMITSLLIPTLLLSYIPHQEPRFLIPLILPLSYLFSQKIYEEPEHSVIEATKMENMKKSPVKKSNFILYLWVICNILFGLFFGFIHQGGIYPASNYLSREITKEPNVKFNIFTNHIYMIPHMLYKQPKIETLYETRHTKFQMSKRVFFYEEGSEDLNFIFEKMTKLLKMAIMDKRENRLLLLLPGALDYELNKISQRYKDFAKVKFIKRFYPHLSTEAMPDISDFLHMITYVEVKNINFEDISRSVINIFESFSLNLYEIVIA